MGETAQQYIARMMANVGDREPLSVQRTTAARLAKAVQRLSPAQMRKSPAPGKWSIAEVLAHLADAEIAIGFRLRLIISQNGSPLQPFDQDLWASSGNYSKHAPAQSIEDFRVLRERNLRLLKSIPKSVWENHGMHAERGRETVAHIVRMIAGHDINHITQVEAMAKKWRSR